VAIGAPQPRPETANQKESRPEVRLLETARSACSSRFTRSSARMSSSRCRMSSTQRPEFRFYRSLSSRSKGVEVSLNCQPVQHWQTQVGFSYNDAHVTHTHRRSDAVDRRTRQQRRARAATSGRATTFPTACSAVSAWASGSFILGSRTLSSTTAPRRSSRSRPSRAPTSRSTTSGSVTICGEHQQSHRPLLHRGRRCTDGRQFPGRRARLRSRRGCPF